MKRAAVLAAITTTAAAAAITLTALAATTHTTTPAPAPAAITVTATVTATHATARHAGDAALTAAFRRYFHHQNTTGMTAWTRTGIEQNNQAILFQARADAFPHRNANLPADAAALAASARTGLAHPSPLDTTGWDTLMHAELTIARELPVIALGNAATTQATTITRDYLAYTQATS